MDQSALEIDEWGERILDLTQKINNDIEEGGYLKDEALPAMCNVIIEIILGTKDPDRMMWRFTRNLVTQYDERDDD